MAFGFLKNLVGKLFDPSVDWDDLEETLIRADLGLPLTSLILEKIKKSGQSITPESIEEIVSAQLAALFPLSQEEILPASGRPKVILLLGVNGTGKTTTTAKLGHHLLSKNHSVLFAAADTFRAAAIEQLSLWGERLGIGVIKGQYQGDSAALCYDAYNAARSRAADFLLCDTAGRLHTKSNLMQELAKVCRTLGKHHPSLPDEKWLVIDATTGMNGLVQAREFHASVGLTGIVLTKLDGSGRGGIAAAIQHELGISPKFIGFGEKAEDFQRFNPEAFVAQLV